MRTTVQLDEDVAAAVDQLRRKAHLGLSEAVNRLIRLGLQRPERARSFEQSTATIGLKVDVANVAEALELLEGPTAR